MKRAHALAAALLASSQGCTIVSNVDVCDREGSPEVDVNHLPAGDQLLWSPQSIDALPNGAALLTFESVEHAGDYAQVRIASLSANGTIRRTCGIDDERTIAPAGSIPVFVTAPSGLAAGMVAHVAPGPEVHALLIDASGCVGLAGIGALPFVVRPFETGVDIKAISAVGIGPNRFALAWLVFDGVGTELRTRHEAAIIEFFADAWRYVPSAAGDTFGDLGIPGNEVDRISLARGPGTTIAAAWYDTEPFRGSVRFALLDDSLRVVTGPLEIGDRPRERASTEAPHTVVAWDGTQYLVVWVAGETDAARVFGRFLDAGGNPLRSELSPDGGTFRVGSLVGGAEKQVTAMALAGGGFLVAWTETDATGREDASGSGLRAISFDARGRVRFSNRACDRRDFALNQSFRGNQSHPILTRLTDGTLLTVFESQAGDAADQSGVALRGRALREWDLFPIEGDRR